MFRSRPPRLLRRHPSKGGELCHQFPISNHHHARAATWGRPYNGDFPSTVYEFPIPNFQLLSARAATWGCPYNGDFPSTVYEFPIPNFQLLSARAVRPHGTVTSDAIRDRSLLTSTFYFPTTIMRGRPHGAAPTTRIFGSPVYEFPIFIFYRRGLFARTEWSRPFPTGYPISIFQPPSCAGGHGAPPYGRVFISRICPLPSHL